MSFHKLDQLNTSKFRRTPLKSNIYLTSVAVLILGLILAIMSPLSTAHAEPTNEWIGNTDGAILEYMADAGFNHDITLTDNIDTTFNFIDGSGEWAQLQDPATGNCIQYHDGELRMSTCVKGQTAEQFTFAYDTYYGEYEMQNAYYVNYNGHDGCVEVGYSASQGLYTTIVNCKGSGSGISLEMLWELPGGAID